MAINLYTKKCEECGKIVETKSFSCPYCGAPLRKVFLIGTFCNLLGIFSSFISIICFIICLVKYVDKGRIPFPFLIFYALFTILIGLVSFKVEKNRKAMLGMGLSCITIVFATLGTIFF